MDTLDISANIKIPISEIAMTAVRSQGAGGQNVNKVATAIHLRFDASKSAALPQQVKARLLQMADRRITEDGIVIIKSQAFKSQERNRQAALMRLAELLSSATRAQRPRIKTKPSRRAREKRLAAKSRRGALKQSRRIRHDD